MRDSYPELGMIVQCERRPCYIYGIMDDVTKGFFHRWVLNSKPDHSYDKYPELDYCGEKCDVCALVELENGSIEYINPRYIQFADGGGFDEVAFIPLSVLLKEDYPEEIKQDVAH